MAVGGAPVTPIRKDGVQPPAGTQADPLFATVSSSPSTASTSAPSQVPAATSSTQLLAANTLRKGCAVYYDGGAILYLLEGTGTASATNYTLKMGAGYLTFYEPPTNFTGALKGIWSSATGAANVTERTA